MAGPQCCEHPPAFEERRIGFGRVETLGDVKVYVSGSPDVKTAIILASDVYGFEAPNLRNLADKIATAGYLVLVPDFFYGDPYIRLSHGDPFANLSDWLKMHEPMKGFEDAKKIIEVLKNRGVNTIGASGFCWGAKVVVELAKGDDIKAAVLLHPSLITVDDFKVVKAPIAILGAETDHISPPEVVEKFGAILSARPEVDSFVKVYPGVAHGWTVDSFVKVYPGVAHGWTVRYDVNDEVAVKNAELAHTKMLEFFNKYLK